MRNVLQVSDKSSLEEVIAHLENMCEDPDAYTSTYLSEIDYIVVTLSDILKNSLNFSKLQFNDLSIDFVSKEVYLKDAPVKLSKKEYDLLSYLIKSNPRLVSKEMLLKYIWRDYGMLMGNTVEVHINRLRKKIGNKYIENIKGFGYRFNSQ